MVLENADNDNSVLDSASAPFEEHTHRGRSPLFRLWLGLGLIAVVTTGMLVLIGFLVKPGYVAFVPGSVRDTEPLVEADSVTLYPSEGELYYTTVRMRQNLSWWEYQFTKLDDDADLRPEEDVLQDRTRDELLELNQAMMTSSKDVAVAVALDRLGFDTIDTDGAVVVQLVEGSAAEKVLELNDVIVGVDGLATVAAIDLNNLIPSYVPGSTVNLAIERNGEPLDVEVTLGARPDDDSKAFLGVGMVDQVVIAPELPFDVDIDSGQVGGPSAGLAFTIAILDALTEGDLTGGHNVAVTGTMSPTGAVGAIGGILQKAAAVDDTEADAFIVPAAQGEDEIAQVQARVGDDVTVYPVATIDEALEVLASLGGNVASIEDFTLES